MVDLRITRHESLLAWTAPILVTLTPVIIALIYPHTVFSPIGSIDSYMFIGLGLNYDDPTVYASYYKITRIPWIMAEYWFRHALPPLAAQYALQLVTHALLGLGVYFGVRRLLGIMPALFGSIFLLAYTELYSSSGADYMNTFSGVLYLAAFYVTTTGALHSRPYVLGVLCGVLFALTVYTNFYFIVFAPMLVGHYALLRRQAGLPQNFLTSLLCATVGVVVGTALLGAIAVAYGRNINFIWPTIRYIQTYVDPAEQSWRRPWSGGWWYHELPWFGYFLATAIASAWLAWTLWPRRGESKFSAAQVSLFLQYVFAFVAFLIMQIQGQSILDANQVMFPIFMPLAMAIAALVSHMRLSENYVPPLAIGVVTWAAILLPLCWHPIFAAAHGAIAQFPPFIVSVVAVVVIVVVASVARKITRIPPTGGLLAMAVVLGLTNVATASVYSVRILEPTSCMYWRDGYLAAVELNRIIHATRPYPPEIYFLADDKETATLDGCGSVEIGELAWSLRSMGLGAMLTEERQAPDFLRFLAAKDSYILVFSLKPGAATELLDKFAALGLSMRAEPVHVQAGKLTLDLTAIRKPRQ